MQWLQYPGSLRTEMSPEMRGWGRQRGRDWAVVGEKHWVGGSGESLVLSGAKNYKISLEGIIVQGFLIFGVFCESALPGLISKQIMFFISSSQLLIYWKENVYQQSLKLS
jgi:hypothetical protein